MGGSSIGPENATITFTSVLPRSFNASCKAKKYRTAARRESVTTIIFAPGYFLSVTDVNVSAMTALFSAKFLGCRLLYFLIVFAASLTGTSGLPSVARTIS